MYRKMIMILLVVILSGCTRYTYYGQIEAEDSDGNLRNHLIYWTKTERILWYDEISGAAWLLTECSLRTVVFDETENGIFFRCTPNDSVVIEDGNMWNMCGEILNADRFAELSDGDMEVKIYSTFLGDDFTIGNHSYLKASQNKYDFIIKREESSEFNDGAPNRPECREMN